MPNDDQTADPKEQIAQLEAALRAERARNTELHERVRALEGQQTKGSQDTGKPAWRRIVLIALIPSFGLYLGLVYPYMVLVGHEDPILTLFVALVFTLPTFVFLLAGLWAFAPRFKELLERSDRRGGTDP